MKILSFIGARPQFVKVFALSKALQELKLLQCQFDMVHILVHSGQHYDYNMSELFFKQLKLPEPDYYLNVGSATHSVQTAKMLERLEPLLLKERPDMMLVFGDTNTTLAGALVASKLGILLVHVEAGLRSYNRTMPEEINRVVTDHLSDLLLCPSSTAVMNLVREGFSNLYSNGELLEVEDIRHALELGTQLQLSFDQPLVINVGDIMYDCLTLILNENEGRDLEILKRFSLKPQNYALATVHRAENTDNPDRLVDILKYIDRVSRHLPVLFPMHPRTHRAYEKLSYKLSDRVILTEPVGYIEMLSILRDAKLVLTDSGGLQKEAFWLRVPCITLRDETEWIETVQSGWNILWKDLDASDVLDFLNGNNKYGVEESVPYGTGKTRYAIMAILLAMFKSLK